MSEHAEQIERDRAYETEHERVRELSDARGELLKRLTRVSDAIENARANFAKSVSFDFVGPLGTKDRVLLGGVLRIRAQPADAPYAGAWVLCGFCLESRMVRVFPVEHIEQIRATS